MGKSNGKTDNRGASTMRAVLALVMVAGTIAMGVQTARAGGGANTLATMLDASEVLILGEKHSGGESRRLVTHIVDHYLADRRCLVVALEIASDEQSALDAAMRGKQAVSAVEVDPIIDRPAYRDLLSALARRVQAGQCLSVRAIDAARGTGDRDAHMARQLLDLIEAGSLQSKIARDFRHLDKTPAMEQVPVLALLGNLHALRKVRWRASARGEPFLAERLINSGIDVVSVAQLWSGKDCGERSMELVTADEPRMLTLMRRAMWMLAAEPAKRGDEVLDAVAVWSCE